MKENRLNLFDYKILYTISTLNKHDDYPNNLGVYKILFGMVDEQTLPYEKIASFSTCISITSKKVSFKIKMLYRYGFISNIYDEKTDQMFLKITPKGEVELTQFLSKHPSPFKRKNHKQETNIIHIEK